MSRVLSILGDSDVKPTGAVQLGSRLFLAFEDHRPVCVMPDDSGEWFRVYHCGIKAPTTGPTVTDGADNAANLLAGETVYVRYAFYSSKRVLFSEWSPETAHTVADPAKKLVINGFEMPRDNAFTQDIDAVAIAVQTGVLSGAMCVIPAMMGFTESRLFYTLSYTFDLSQSTLAQGFNATVASPYYSIPPAVRYLEKHGNRLYLGGQREKLTFGEASGVTVTPGQSFRGRTVAKVTVEGAKVLDDSHTHMRLVVNGGYVGNVWDVLDGWTAYLDRDVKDTIENTVVFALHGSNDRVWPTSYHNENAGHVAVIYPETVNLLHEVVVPTALDDGQVLKGIKRNRDYLGLIFSDSVVMASGGDELNSPAPTLQTQYGRAGAIAPRSITLDQDGALIWIGEEGITRGTTAGVYSIAHELGINQFFKGGRWVDPESLKNAVMTYSRQYDGYVLGNLRVWNPTDEEFEEGWWGLLAIKPQYGLFLFDGQLITSNLLEYADENGRGVILAGDGQDGRVKRLLSPETLADVHPYTEGATQGFTCEWREGWQSRSDGKAVAPGALDLVGIIVPGSALMLWADYWRSDFPVRHEDDLPAANQTTVTIDRAKLLRSIPGPGVRARYHSLGLRWLSTSGAAGVRGVELTRWQLSMNGEVA
ncbi:MAG: hypothetical protein ABFD89_23850 [Bryobacteraceae bacterium]